jgi:hypothetical protein
MPVKIEIHKRLGLSIERVDEIFDEIFDVFKKNRSLRETVEFVNEHYDSESIAAGITLNMILTEVLSDIERNSK